LWLYVGTADCTLVQNESGVHHQLVNHWTPTVIVGIKKLRSGPEKWSFGKKSAYTELKHCYCRLAGRLIGTWPVRRIPSKMRLNLRLGIKYREEATT
jgi:hypothetical protein